MRLQPPLGFTNLECVLLLAILLFTGFIVWLMIRSSRNGGGGPRGGG